MSIEATLTNEARDLEAKYNAVRIGDGSTQTDFSREEWTAAREEILRFGWSWPVVGWLAMVHVGAIAALWFFSWQGVVLALVLHWVTGGLGVCLGYHRLLTHRSFATSRPMRYFFSWLGGLAGEGSCLTWVANHRKHHAHSDHVGDPHSPHNGSWWSHMFWCMADLPTEEKETFLARWVPDMKDDRVLRFLDATFIPWHIVTGLVIAGIGYQIGGSHMAWSLMTWGIFFRLTAVLHSTWLVNSASHIWGYRNYETSDDSRNNWIVAVVTYGEGWHNNHHAYPRMARHGHRWWEIDLTFLTIRTLERLGLVWDVVDNQHKKKKEAVAA